MPAPWEVPVLARMRVRHRENWLVTPEYGHIDLSPTPLQAAACGRLGAGHAAAREEAGAEVPPEAAGEAGARASPTASVGREGHGQSGDQGGTARGRASICKITKHLIA